MKTLESLKIEKYEIPDGDIYKPSAPFKAVVESNTRLTADDSEDDIRNIVLNIHGHNVNYIEGQSVGVVPPGTDENGKKHRVRMYSIASHRKGDDGESTTVTLCIKRVNFINPEGEHIVGLASNYMCDLQPGDEVDMIGPTGRRFILPKDPTTDIIMIAVGTGIAPFRAFVKYLYDQKITVNNRVRLFYGVKTGMEALYMNDENDDIGQYLNQETFRAFKALSDIGDDEEDKGLVQHRIKENINDVWEIIEDGNFSIYVCGLKVMAHEVENVLREEAESHGYNWDELLKEFKAAGRWNVEVY